MEIIIIYLFLSKLTKIHISTKMNETIMKKKLLIRIWVGFSVLRDSFCVAGGKITPLSKTLRIILET